MWDNQAWSYLHRADEEAEPRFLTQDFIHAIQPDARIIITLRDPVERWNKYLKYPFAFVAVHLSDLLLVSVPGCILVTCFLKWLTSQQKTST